MAGATREVGRARARRFVMPRAGETLEAIAGRELPDQPAETSAAALRGWNPHLALRIGRPEGLLPTDIVYLEPPLRA
jgi:hypothetical protein